MRDKTKMPPIGTEEHWQWIQERLIEDWQKVASGKPADLDESGIISGGGKSLTSTDAEAFPDEVEEYTP